MCATVCLTVVPLFSDITDVSTIGHSFKTDSHCIPLFHFAQFGDDIIGRELNLDENCMSAWKFSYTSTRKCVYTHCLKVCVPTSLPESVPTHACLKVCLHVRLKACLHVCLKVIAYTSAWNRAYTSPESVPTRPLESVSLHVCLKMWRLTGDLQEPLKS